MEGKLKKMKDAIKALVVEGNAPGLELKETQGNRKGLEPWKVAGLFTDTSSPDCDWGIINGLENFAKVTYAEAERFFLDKIADPGLTKKAAKEAFALAVEGILERGNPSTEVVITKEDA